jgi:hypothetical protein
MSKRKHVDWSAVQAHYDAGHTMAECKALFGFSNGSWDRARRRGEVKTRGRGGWRGGHDTRRDVQRLLNEGRSNAEVAATLRVSTGTVSYHARKLGVPPDTRFRDHLKGRLINAGLKEKRCELCGIDSWMGKPLNVQLHHKNGDGTDNRLPNLQFLCPNCHSQTETYGGRNGHRRPDRRLRLAEPEDEEEAA